MPRSDSYETQDKRVIYVMTDHPKEKNRTMVAKFTFDETPRAKADRSSSRH